MIWLLRCLPERTSSNLPAFTTTDHLSEAQLSWRTPNLERTGISRTDCGRGRFDPRGSATIALCSRDRLIALSLHDYPAIGMQDRAAEVGALLARQEERRIRDVDRLADSLERDAPDGALEALAPLHLLGHRRIDHARTDRVSGYIVAAEVPR